MPFAGELLLPKQFHVTARLLDVYRNRLEPDAQREEAWNYHIHLTFLALAANWPACL